MSYNDPQAQGWRRDAARSAGVVAHEVKRRKEAERDRDHWKALAIALLRWPLG